MTDLNRGRFAEGATLRNQFGLRSAMDLAGFQIDVLLRHIGVIRHDPQIVTGEGIPAYTELDLRIARAWNRIELALAGQNLLHAHHPEFGSPAHRGQIERSIYASIAWRYQGGTRFKRVVVVNNNRYPIRSTRDVSQIVRAEFMVRD
jgi:hypothetical protein